MKKEDLVIGQWYYKPSRLQEYYKKEQHGGKIYIFFKYCGWDESNKYNGFMYSDYIDSAGRLIKKPSYKSSDIANDIHITEEELSKYCKEILPVSNGTYDIY